MISQFLGGIDIIVVPDDDDRLKGLPPHSAAIRGWALYVAESDWPALRDALRKHEQERAA